MATSCHSPWTLPSLPFPSARPLPPSLLHSSTPPSTSSLSPPIVPSLLLPLTAPFSLKTSALPPYLPILDPIHFPLFFLRSILSYFPPLLTGSSSPHYYLPSYTSLYALASSPTQCLTNYPLTHPYLISSSPFLSFDHLSSLFSQSHPLPPLFSMFILSPVSS